MTNFEQYRKDNGPAFGESETEYFVRLTNKYKKIHQAEVNRARIERIRSFVANLARRVVVTPNLLQVKSI